MARSRRDAHHVGIMIKRRFPLGRSPWPTIDPFLFIAYHLDDYPEGTESLGPDEAELKRRPIGMDFENPSGWNMYHGDLVPGFPAHPHRGFETVTYVRRGICDHADSLGAAARFGQGDTQWLTAGGGIVHSEMFPLLSSDEKNPLELFQIWLNLPAADKYADPHFAIFWSEETPTIVRESESGAKARAVIIAGSFGDEVKPLSPPPASWASRDESDIAIWHLELEDGASIELPQAREGSHRLAYFFDGAKISVDGEELKAGEGAELDATKPGVIRAEGGVASLIILQGKPIGESVAHHGPFVMNDDEGLRQAFLDYQRTLFGGWPWPDKGPVHGRQGRFARYPDGKVEERA